MNRAIQRGCHLLIGDSKQTSECHMVISAESAPFAGVLKATLDESLVRSHSTRSLVTIVTMNPKLQQRLLDKYEVTTYLTQEFLEDLIDRSVTKAIKKQRQRVLVEQHFLKHSSSLVSMETIKTINLIPSSSGPSSSLKTLCAPWLHSLVFWNRMSLSNATDNVNVNKSKAQVTLMEDIFLARKLWVLFQGVLNDLTGPNSKRVPLKTLEKIIRKNEYLSLLCETLPRHVGDNQYEENAMLGWDEVKTFFGLNYNKKLHYMACIDEKDVPEDVAFTLVLVRRHFRRLCREVDPSSTKSKTKYVASKDGFNCVNVKQLMNFVLEDIKKDLEHGSLSESSSRDNQQEEVSDMEDENNADEDDTDDENNNSCGPVKKPIARSDKRHRLLVEQVKVKCSQLVDAFHCQRYTPWYEMEYFIRYGLYFEMDPQLFASSPERRLVTFSSSASSSQVLNEMHSSVAEILIATGGLGNTSPLLYVLFFDGCVEVWTLEQSKCLSRSFVLTPGKPSHNKSASPRKSTIISPTKSSMSTSPSDQSSQETNVEWFDEVATVDESVYRRVASAIELFRTSFSYRATKASIMQLSCSDMLLCINGTFLDGTFRFHKVEINQCSTDVNKENSNTSTSVQLARMWTVRPEHRTVSLPNIKKEDSSGKNQISTRNISSLGVADSFQLDQKSSILAYTVIKLPMTVWLMSSTSGIILSYVSLDDNSALRLNSSNGPSSYCLFSLHQQSGANIHHPSVLLYLTRPKDAHVSVWTVDKPKRALLQQERSIGQQLKPLVRCCTLLFTQRKDQNGNQPQDQGDSRSSGRASNGSDSNNIITSLCTSAKDLVFVIRSNGALYAWSMRQFEFRPHASDSKKSDHSISSLSSITCLFPVLNQRVFPNVEDKVQVQVSSLQNVPLVSTFAQRENVSNQCTIVLQEEAKEHATGITGNDRKGHTQCVFLYAFVNGQVVSIPVDAFDPRFVTLDDVVFEMDNFQQPQFKTSSYHHDEETVLNDHTVFLLTDRVLLQKHEIVRVGFLVFHHEVYKKNQRSRYLEEEEEEEEEAQESTATKTMNELLHGFIEQDQVLIQRNPINSFETFRRAHESPSLQMDLVVFDKAQVKSTVQKSSFRRDLLLANVSSRIVPSSQDTKSSSLDQVICWHIKSETTSFQDKINSDLDGDDNEEEDNQQHEEIDSNLKEDISNTILYLEQLRLERIKSLDKSQKIIEKERSTRQQTIETIQLILFHLFASQITSFSFKYDENEIPKESEDYLLLLDPELYPLLLQQIRILCMVPSHMENAFEMIDIQEFFCQLLYDGEKSTKVGVRRGRLIELLTHQLEDTDKITHNPIYQWWIQQLVSYLTSKSTVTTTSSKSKLTWTDVDFILRRLRSIYMSFEQIFCLLNDLEVVNTSIDHQSKTQLFGAFCQEFCQYLSLQHAKSQMKTNDQPHKASIVMCHAPSPVDLPTVARFLIDRNSFPPAFVNKQLQIVVHRLNELTRTTSHTSMSNNPLSRIYAKYLLNDRWCQLSKEIQHLLQSIRSDLAPTSISTSVVPVYNVSQQKQQQEQQIKRLLDTRLSTFSESRHSEFTSIVIQRYLPHASTSTRLAFEAVGNISNNTEDESSKPEAIVTKNSLTVYLCRSEKDIAQTTQGRKMKQQIPIELAFYKRILQKAASVLFLPVLPVQPSKSMVHGMTIPSDQFIIVAEDTSSSMLPLSSVLKSVQSLLKGSAFSIQELGPVLLLLSQKVLLMLLTAKKNFLYLGDEVEVDDLFVSIDGQQLRLMALDQLSPLENKNQSNSEQNSIVTFGQFVYTLLTRLLLNGQVEMIQEQSTLEQKRTLLVQLIHSKQNTRSNRNIDAFTTSDELLSEDTEELELQEEDSNETDMIPLLAKMALFCLQDQHQQQLTSTPFSLEDIWGLFFYDRVQSDDFLLTLTNKEPVSERLMRYVYLEFILDKTLLTPLKSMLEEDKKLLVEVDNLYSSLVQWIDLFLMSDLNDPLMDDFFHRHFINQHDVFNQTMDLSLEMFNNLYDRGGEFIQKAHGMIVNLLSTWKKILEKLNDQLQNVRIINWMIQTSLSCLTRLGVGCCSIKHCEAVPSSAACLTLWRLSEPLLKEILLGKNTTLSNLHRWLNTQDKCKNKSNKVPIIPINKQQLVDDEESQEKDMLHIWWKQKDALLPSIGPITNHNITLRNLKVLYKTCEILFGIFAAVGVPKFRASTSQRLISTVFFTNVFTNKSKTMSNTTPLVMLKHSVASVWMDDEFLDFAPLFSQLLRREKDERVLLVLLSFVELCTRILRFHPVRHASVATCLVDNNEDILLDTEYIHFLSSSQSSTSREFAKKLVTCSMLIHEITYVFGRMIGFLKVGSEERPDRIQLTCLHVMMSFFVNCLHAGDTATNGWIFSQMTHPSLIQLMLSHAKAHTLASIFQQRKNGDIGGSISASTSTAYPLIPFFPNEKTFGQLSASGPSSGRSRISSSRTGGQTRKTRTWSVFSSCTNRCLVDCSSLFELFLVELAVGPMSSTRNVLLLESLLNGGGLFRQFLLDKNAWSMEPFKREMCLHEQFGQVGHLVDIQKDLLQDKGTLEEILHFIEYTRAQFKLTRATTNMSSSMVQVFMDVFVQCWQWLEEFWRLRIREVDTSTSSMLLSSSTSSSSITIKTMDLQTQVLKLAHRQQQANIIVALLSLLHDIVMLSNQASCSLNEFMMLLTRVKKQDDFTTTKNNKDMSILHVDALDLVLTCLSQSFEQLNKSKTLFSVNTSKEEDNNNKTKKKQKSKTPPKQETKELTVMNANSGHEQCAHLLECICYSALEVILDLCENISTASEEGVGGQSLLLHVLTHFIQDNWRKWVRLFDFNSTNNPLQVEWKVRVYKAIVHLSLLDSSSDTSLDKKLLEFLSSQVVEKMSKDPSDGGGLLCLQNRLTSLFYVEIFVELCFNKHHIEVMDQFCKLLQEHQVIEKELLFLHTLVKRNEKELNKTIIRMFQLICSVSSCDTSLQNQLTQIAKIPLWVLQFHQQHSLNKQAKAICPLPKIVLFWKEWELATSTRTLVFDQEGGRLNNNKNKQDTFTNRPHPSIQIYVNERQMIHDYNVNHDPSPLSSPSSSSSSPTPWSTMKQQDTLPSFDDLEEKQTEAIDQKEDKRTVNSYELSMKTLLDCLGDEIAFLQQKFDKFVKKGDPSIQIRQSQLLRLLWECGLSHVTSTCLTTCSSASTTSVLTFSDFLMVYAKLSGLEAQVVEVATVSTETSSTTSLDKAKWFKLANGHWQKLRMVEMVPLRLSFDTYMVTTGVLERISVEHATQALCPLVTKYTKRQIHEEIVQLVKSNTLLTHDTTEGHSSNRGLSFHDFCRVFVQLTHDKEHAAKTHRQPQHRLQYKKNQLTKPTNEGGPSKAPVLAENKIKFHDLTVGPTRLQPLPKAGGIPEANTTKNLVQALIKVDMDSATLLESSPKTKTKKKKKDKVKSKQEEDEKEEDAFSMDSDAYSPIPSEASQSGSDSDAFSSDSSLDHHRAKAAKKHHSTSKLQDKKLSDLKEKESEAKALSSDSSSDSESKQRIVKKKNFTKKKKKRSHELSMYQKRKLEKQQRILRQVFTKYDVNGDGNISFIDLRRAFDHQQPHHSPPDLELHRWIAEKDRTGKGTVNFEDFVFAFRSAAVGATKEQLNTSITTLPTAIQRTDLVLSLPTQASHPTHRSITMTTHPLAAAAAHAMEGHQQKNQLRREEFAWRQRQRGKDSAQAKGYRLGGTVILDPEKKSQLTQLFQMYDRNQDGVITLEDLREHFEERGETNIREEDMQKWIQEKNSHEPNKQSVHLEEFLQAYK